MKLRLLLRNLECRIFRIRPHVASKFAFTLTSETGGEISLSVWTTQSYKGYARSRMTGSPLGTVDKLFAPLNVAGAISTSTADMVTPV